RANRRRRARRRRGRRSIVGGPRTIRAGLPCPWVHQTRTSCPRPAKASAGVRRPARHGSGSRPSPSRGAAGAQPPTPAAIRSGVCSSRDALSRFPCLSLHVFLSYVSSSPCLLSYIVHHPSPPSHVRPTSAQPPIPPSIRACRSRLIKFSAGYGAVGVTSVAGFRWTCRSLPPTHAQEAGDPHSIHLDK